MSLDSIIADLTGVPLRRYDDLAAGSAAAPPLRGGVYAWWQAPGALPRVSAPPHPSEPLELLYVGIARSNLRERLSNHHRSAVGSSTFRFDLASFLWEPCGWQPCWTDRVTLRAGDLTELAAWQREHLAVQWVEALEPWKHEADVIGALAPALNQDHNRGNPCSADVAQARGALRAAARSAHST